MPSGPGVPSEKETGWHSPTPLRFSSCPQQKALTTPSAPRGAEQRRAPRAPDGACVTRAQHVPSLSTGQVMRNLVMLEKS